MARPETILQREMKAHIEAVGLYTVHVPNGVVLGGNPRQRAIQMASLKRDGLRVGFPDLVIYASQGRVGHIEVKCEGGKQSDKQIDCQRDLEALDHRYAVCRSIADVDETLQEWGFV